MNSPHIEIKKLNLHYGSLHVLKDVSIVVPRRSITAIIGPSGCGKTSLLRAINRLIDNVEGAKVSGEILVDGRNILAPDVSVVSIRKKIGLLGQKPVALPMSIFDNVAFGLRIHGLNHKARLRDKVEYYLTIAGLWDEVKDRLHAPAHCLSVGQLQRLCLARGLAVEPEIILADEPTSALDPASSQAIEKKFAELKKDYTMVIVTHNIRQAQRIADHVVFIYLGDIVECGHACTFFTSPQDTRTRAFVNGDGI